MLGGVRESKGDVDRCEYASCMYVEEEDMGLPASIRVIVGVRSVWD